MKLNKKLIMAVAVAGLTALVSSNTVQADDEIRILPAANAITVSSGSFSINNPTTVTIPDVEVYLKEVEAEEKAIALQKQKEAEAAAAAEAARIAEENRTVLPVDGGQITSDFGVVRNVILQDGRYWSDVHNGVDYVNGNPNAPIRAYKKGTVVEAGVNSSGAYYVIIKHDGHYSNYYHMAAGSLTVKVGDQVSAGQTIGIMGSTGFSTGNHLHFGISSAQNSGDLNPHDFLPS